MYNRPNKYLTDQKILHPQQFGFWKGYSIEYAVAQLVDQIYESFENDSYNAGIFVNLGQVFRRALCHLAREVVWLVLWSPSL